MKDNIAIKRNCKIAVLIKIVRRMLIAMRKAGGGACHALSVYKPVHYNKKIFYTAAEIMNYESVNNFCNTLGAKPLARQDLDCEEMGPGCLDNDAVALLQSLVGSGFYWLEKYADDKFYYFDMNDGTVYYVPKDSISHMQAICVKEE